MMSLDFEDLLMDRASGIQWDAERDKLSIRVADTRRGIMSFVSGLYDPLDFAAPLVLPAKILLQELWKLDVGWDEEIQSERLKERRTWIESLFGLKLVSWPRCHKPEGLVATECSASPLFGCVRERARSSVIHLS